MEKMSLCSSTDTFWYFLTDMSSVQIPLSLTIELL